MEQGSQAGEQTNYKEEKQNKKKKEKVLKRKNNKQDQIREM